jgi:hypothetical protein
MAQTHSGLVCRLFREQWPTCLVQQRKPTDSCPVRIGVRITAVKQDGLPSNALREETASLGLRRCHQNVKVAASGCAEDG